MPKYIFQESDYKKFDQDYVDHLHEEYIGSTVKTGKIYNQTKVRGFTMPGDSESMDRYGYATNMWMGANSFAPGGIYDSHQHESFQYMFVIEGKGKVIVDGEESIATQGTYIFVPPFKEHYMENIGDSPFTYLLVGGNPPETE